MTEISFWVPGIPQPGGSKRGFHRGGHVVVVDANPKAKDWKASAAQVASEVMKAKAPLTIPLSVTFEFYFPRPAGHFRSRDRIALKSSAPAFPTVRPDALKCARSTEDALTGIAWQDDSQIVTESIAKRYATFQPGCRVTIREET